MKFGAKAERRFGLGPECQPTGGRAGSPHPRQKPLAVVATSSSWKLLRMSPVRSQNRPEKSMLNPVTPREHGTPRQHLDRDLGLCHHPSPREVPAQSPPPVSGIQVHTLDSVWGSWQLGPKGSGRGDCRAHRAPRSSWDPGNLTCSPAVMTSSGGPQGGEEIGSPWTGHTDRRDRDGALRGGLEASAQGSRQEPRAVGRLGHTRSSSSGQVRGRADRKAGTGALRPQLHSWERA